MQALQKQPKNPDDVPANTKAVSEGTTFKFEEETVVKGLSEINNIFVQDLKVTVDADDKAPLRVSVKVANVSSGNTPDLTIGDDKAKEAEYKQGKRLQLFGLMPGIFKIIVNKAGTQGKYKEQRASYLLVIGINSSDKAPAIVRVSKEYSETSKSFDKQEVIGEIGRKLGKDFSGYNLRNIKNPAGKVAVLWNESTKEFDINSVGGYVVCGNAREGQCRNAQCIG